MEYLQLDFSEVDISEMTLTEIRDHIENKDKFKEDLFKQLMEDPRKGTTRLAQYYKKRIKKLRQEQERINRLKEIETELHKKGYKYIAGVDEVGRGSIAGPVMAAAVILPSESRIPGVNDSKKLTAHKREDLYINICNQAKAIGLGQVDAKEIDEIGIAMATRLAMKKSVENLNIKPEFILMDGFKVEGLETPVAGIKYGDNKCYTIAAASIVAKVSRDRLMIKLSKDYLEYEWHKNMGYGTKEHGESVEKYGYCPLHRRSFKFHQVEQMKMFKVDKGKLNNKKDMR